MQKVLRRIRAIKLLRHEGIPRSRLLLTVGEFEGQKRFQDARLAQNHVT